MDTSSHRGEGRNATRALWSARNLLRYPIIIFPVLFLYQAQGPAAQGRTDLMSYVYEIVGASVFLWLSLALPTLFCLLIVGALPRRWSCGQRRMAAVILSPLSVVMLAPLWTANVQAMVAFGIIVPAAFGLLIDLPRCRRPIQGIPFDRAVRWWTSSPLHIWLVCSNVRPLVVHLFCIEGARLFGRCSRAGRSRA